MQLPDHEIWDAVLTGWLGYWPFDPDLLQPASIDMRLGEELYDPATDAYLHPDVHAGWWLRPDAFLLGCTAEAVKLPADLAARIEGKSTLGRRGIAVHVTAGFVDPGFEGQLTLELKNLSRVGMFLRPGMLIAQMSVHKLSAPAANLYGAVGVGSHYQGQRGPTPAAGDLFS
jgi:dCTP deaminase